MAPAPFYIRSRGFTWSLAQTGSCYRAGLGVVLFLQMSESQPAQIARAVALIAFIYGAAFIGQGLGAEDMYELRSFVDRIADGVKVSA